MSYGDNSGNMAYEGDGDYFEPPAQQEEPKPEQPAKEYVPIEQYQQLSQQFQQAQPKLEVIDRLQQVFNPNQAPQVTPEQQAAIDFVRQQAQEAYKPQEQQFQAVRDELLEGWAKNKGFEDRHEAADWAYMVRTQLIRKGSQGDNYAMQLGQALDNTLSKGDWFAAKELIDRNWEKVNSYAGRYAIKAAPQQQTIGHSFSNNPYTGVGQPQSPQQYREAIAAARKAGNQGEVQRLIGEMGQIVQTLI